MELTNKQKELVNKINNIKGLCTLKIAKTYISVRALFPKGLRNSHKGSSNNPYHVFKSYYAINEAKAKEYGKDSSYRATMDECLEITLKGLSEWRQRMVRWSE